LTFKGAARFSGGIKTREERETEVGNPAQLEAILAGIGLTRRFRYEKRREEWSFEGCTVALDETPIGRFVEVEGEPTAIRRAVAALALDFGEALPYSYSRLYLERRREDPTLPEDMVFTGREA
jgi:adenylate cyclase class 2